MRTTNYLSTTGAYAKCRVYKDFKIAGKYFAVVNLESSELVDQMYPYIVMDLLTGATIHETRATSVDVAEVFARKLLPEKIRGVTYGQAVQNYQNILFPQILCCVLINMGAL